MVTFSAKRRLGPEAERIEPSVGANRSAPRGRAVDEHAVRERHAAEPQLLHAREGTVRRWTPRPVLDLIAAARRRRQAVVLVGIGGHGGAGKSTLARMIPGAQVVGTDEFWDGEEFEIERLAREVLEPLVAGRAARFTSTTGTPASGAASGRSSPTGIVVVEGVCALHRMFRDAYDVRVWVEAPYDAAARARRSRGTARTRGGPGSRSGCRPRIATSSATTRSPPPT